MRLLTSILTIFIFFDYSFCLKCRSVIKGVFNGTEWNYDNSLNCPKNINYCISLNGTFAYSNFSVTGTFQNCFGSGLLGKYITEILPEEYRCQKNDDCLEIPNTNLTRCCCSTNMCTMLDELKPKTKKLAVMPDDIPKIPRHRGKKNRPLNTPWRQQNLPALRPTYNISSAIPVTAFFGSVVLALGLALFFGHMRSLEQEVKYTDCVNVNGSEPFTTAANKSFACSYTIILDENYEGDVKFYYGLSRFYQNNRLYFQSRNDEQLKGDLNNTDGCDPMEYVKVNGTKVPIVPCGQVADSFFNDTFQLFYVTNPDLNEMVRVPWTIRGVLGETEMKRKFRNPPRTGNETLCDVFEGTIRPPSWKIDICKLGANNDTNGEQVGVAFENIDFMVWMKAAALSNFRKLYRKLDRQVDMFSAGLPAGNYTLIINYNYPVSMYGGDKYFVIARETWVGPRNFFLPIVYLVVGTFLLLVTAFFVLIWLKQKISSRIHPQ
ncbi:unnamed protein product [Caenorhabditis bovis]|uniref:Cell cycle control protein 50A n=1 Tax=Caenorhabditis bovis TaxID=2654633 RepID=A0A8S1FA44_9PELO|nr:unnamed protein product [Caenorhabditis bovis]